VPLIRPSRLIFFFVLYKKVRRLSPGVANGPLGVGKVSFIPKERDPASQTSGSFVHFALEPPSLFERPSFTASSINPQLAFFVSDTSFHNLKHGSLRRPPFLLSIGHLFTPRSPKPRSLPFTLSGAGVYFFPLGRGRAAFSFPPPPHPPFPLPDHHDDALSS